MAKRILKAWSTCIDCGYQGGLEYSHLAGEDYEDEEAVGVMMSLYCPACESRENTLVPIDLYRQLLEEQMPEKEKEED